MNSKVTLLCVLLLATASAGAAQLYRWVDNKGNVEWRDTPPPATAKNVEQRKMGSNVISTGEVPFALQQAMKNHPVTFWAVPDCGTACATARAHLDRRGTPYTEKNAQAELEAFKKLTGGSEVPFLQVGAMRTKGYLESDYDSTLDAAGYPRTATIIKPKPAPAAPKPATDGAKPTDAAPTPPPTDSAKK